MPDISLCTNDSCTQKETCYRYKATPNEYWQSYTSFQQDNENGECNNYIEMEDEKNK